MYRTYIINAPMLFTGVWKIVRNFIHPVTAAKISVSSWGHEAVMKKDNIELFNGTIKESYKSWRSVVAELRSSPGLSELSSGCYTPPEDTKAIAALDVWQPPHLQYGYKGPRLY
jgi:hypothetical protein